MFQARVRVLGSWLSCISDHEVGDFCGEAIKEESRQQDDQQADEDWMKHMFPKI